MSVALVTGGLGFVGSHLRPLLRDRGWSVVVVNRGSGPEEPGERLLSLDLTDAAAVREAVGDVRPDVVFHLAASTPQRTGALDELVADVVTATVNVASAVRHLGRAGTRLVVAGSSAQYGDVPQADNPVTEEAAQRPANAYGFAKAAAEGTARALAADGAFEVVPIRAFNHVGPGEPARMVAGALARRVAAVLNGTSARMEAAGLDAVRDFSDVRDIAVGYLAAAERGRPGRAYNLCSGRATSVGQVLDGLLQAAGLDRSIIDIRPPRSAGIAYQVGSPDRSRRELGWEAQIPLQTSLSDLLADVRSSEAAVTPVKGIA